MHTPSARERFLSGGMAILCLAVIGASSGCGREPFAIKGAGFEAEDCDVPAQVKIIRSDGDQIFAGEGSRIPIVEGKARAWCDGATHEWIGKLSYRGHTFDSDKESPLKFTVKKGKGYVYISGRGIVDGLRLK